MVKGLLRTSGEKKEAAWIKKGSGAANLMKGGDGRKRSGVFNYSQITQARQEMLQRKSLEMMWTTTTQCTVRYLPAYLSSWNLKPLWLQSLKHMIINMLLFFFFF